MIMAIISTMTDNFSVPWILGTPAFHLSFDVFSVSHISFCITLIRTDDAEFGSYLNDLELLYLESFFFSVCLKRPFSPQYGCPSM